MWGAQTREGSHVGCQFSNGNGFVQGGRGNPICNASKRKSLQVSTTGLICEKKSRPRATFEPQNDPHPPICHLYCMWGTEHGQIPHPLPPYTAPRVTDPGNGGIGKRVNGLLGHSKKKKNTDKSGRSPLASIWPRRNCLLSVATWPRPSPCPPPSLFGLLYVQAPRPGGGGALKLERIGQSGDRALVLFVKSKKG